MSLIDEYEFKKCVDRYKGDRHAIRVTVPAAPSCRERGRFIPSRKNGKDEKETGSSPGQKTRP